MSNGGRSYLDRMIEIFEEGLVLRELRTCSKRVPEAARRLGVSKSRVYRILDRKKRRENPSTDDPDPDPKPKPSSPF